MPNKGKRIPWEKLGGKKFLEKHAGKPFEELADAIEKKCGIRPTRASISNTCSRYGVKRPRHNSTPKGQTPWAELGGEKFLGSLKDKPLDEVADIVEQKCGIRPSNERVRKKFNEYGIKRSNKGATRSAKQQLEKEIRERLAVYIAEGALVDSKIGFDRLYTILRDEFANRLKETGYSFTKAHFPAFVEEVYWTKERLQALEDAHQSGADSPIDEFLKHAQACTREMAERKARALKGVTKLPAKQASFLPGLGRLDMDEITQEEISNFRLPEASASNPYHIDVPDKHFAVSILNGPNVGLAYQFDIDHNVPRRALAESRIRDAKAVVVSGLFDVDTTKAAGALKVQRALVSGLKVNPGTLDVSFQDEAKRILEDRKKGLSTKDTELLYTTAEDRLRAILDAWHKITHRPKNHKHPEKGIRPEFDGFVPIIFGYKELELVIAVTYAEARWLTIKKQEELRASIKLKKHEIREAEEAHSKAEDLDKLDQEREYLEKQLARTIISNVSEEDFTRQFRRVLPLVVKKFESVIPNSKVIGIGTSSIRFGNKTVEFNVPSHTRSTSRQLNDYNQGYAPKVLRGEIADSVVIMNPHAVSYHAIDRSRDENGERKSMLVHVAPIAIDGEYLRKRLSRMVVRQAHPIAKLVFNEEFKPGMLMLDFHNGLIDGYQIDVNTLARHEEREKKKDGKWTRARIPLKSDPEIKYINYVMTTDVHYGSRNRESIYAPDLGRYVGCDEALFLLLRRDGLCNTSQFPFHMYSMNDDPTQGNHLKIWQQQPNPNEMPLPKIEERWGELRARFENAQTKDGRQRIFEEARQFNLEQIGYRPPDWFQTQLQLVCHKHVDDNVDIFDSILSNAVRAGIIFRGISDYEGTEYDSRDLGCLNSGSGNHGTKSTDGEMTEGWIISDRIWLRLLAKQKWQKFGEENLRRLVRAPLYSNMFMAWGSVQAGDGYEWAFDMRDSPPKMRGWMDTLLGWISVDGSRGNYSRLLNGRMAIKTCGDKHFHAAAHTPYAMYVMGAPCTHTDQFAEMAGGLPPNSTGITSVCLPKDGPDSGPILVRFFPYERLKYFVERPDEKIDWNAMFPNPL